MTFDDCKESIAYVMQQDALLGSQTVWETLMFAAKLKLPSNLTDNAIKRNVEQVLKQLDLWHVKDVPIGDALVKGISGGQKKRVSAAIELLTRPPVMFLDEPTSGLDSFSSMKLIAELKNIAMSENSIICCTIHQPSSELFDNFDRALCMRDGEIMFNGYNGKAAEVLMEGTQTVGQFKSREEGKAPPMGAKIATIPGFLELVVQQPIPPGYNTADWLMYLAQSMDEEDSRECIEQVQSSSRKFYHECS